MKHTLPLLATALTIALATTAHANTVYEATLSGTITSVNPALPDYDPTLANLSPGDTFLATYTLERAPFEVTSLEAFHNIITSTIHIDDGTPEGLTFTMTPPAYAYTIWQQGGPLFLEQSSSDVQHRWQTHVDFGPQDDWPLGTLPTSDPVSGSFGFYADGGFDAAFGPIESFSARFIPTPGALTPLVLATLAATRRRR